MRSQETREIMMNKILLCALIGTLALSSVFGQRNMEFVSQMTYDNLLNDIWGYQASDGTEYAIVGLRSGVSIVNLSQPDKPTESAFVPGPFSIWRDIKTFKDFAYVTTDQGGTKEGLLIIDLRTLPDSVSYYNWKPDIGGLPLQKCHNLYIDDRGIVYLAGCNVNGGGVVMADVASEPGQPRLIGPATNAYAHDVYVQDGVLFASEIYSGELGIYDVGDVNAPSIVSLASTPFSFTHNAWASTDGKTVFTTDERSNAPVAAFDISNPGNARLLDEFRPLETIGTGVVPHNVHVIENWLAISYYTDGAVIVDASRPDNLIEVGNYDTSPNFQTGFHGAWGVYPFLPSGLLIAADIENGLFVLKPKYVKACYLEGLVTDKKSGDNLKGVTVNILADQINQNLTDPFGKYKTGLAEAGTYTVEFTKAGYFTERVEVQLKNGILTELDVALRPKISYSLSGQIVDGFEKTGIGGGQVMLQSEDTSYVLTANQAGLFEANNIYEDEYKIYAAAWGYQQKIINTFSILNNEELTIELEAGYEDDFVLDQGWQVSGNALSGLWVREKPIGTKYQNRSANPSQDIENDLGDMAYITGNRGGSAGTDDVDDGRVQLQSPPIDISQLSNPKLSFYYWFYNGGGEVPVDDTLKISITNTKETYTLIEETGTTLNQWVLAEYSLDSLIATDQPLFLIIETGDAPESGHIVEAGFDGFRIVNENISTSTSDADPEPSAIKGVYPNPFKSQVSFMLQAAAIEQDRRIVIYNTLGQSVFTQELNPQRTLFEWQSDQPSGIYFAHLFDGNRAVGKYKLIKR